MNGKLYVPQIITNESVLIILKKRGINHKCDWHFEEKQINVN